MIRARPCKTRLWEVVLLLLLFLLLLCVGRDALVTATGAWQGYPDRLERLPRQGSSQYHDNISVSFEPKSLIEYEWLLKTQWNHKWSQNSTRSSFFQLQLTLHALYGNSKQLATNKQTKIKFSCGKHVKPTLLSIHAVFKSASVFHGHRKGSDKEPKRDPKGQLGTEKGMS